MAKSSWWQTTTIYEVYPLSFKDSNGDGIGDVPGIISKLDYIKDLGFETIWVTPFYKTPMQDHAYDISDYLSIDPRFGSMEDARRLIDETHKRGMRILFDMVMNHTSVEHDWFRESRSSRTSPKRNWYIWRDGRGKRPPTNWKSMVGNNGWQYDEGTRQWYYANFLRFQPDLNYYNPEVKKAMFDVVRFWLDRGVDGFRLDIFCSLYKDEEFKDNPFRFKIAPSPDDQDGNFQRKTGTLNNPKNYELARELRSVIDEYSPERMLLGEVFGSEELVKKYLGANHDGLHLIFLFDTLLFRFRASFFREILERFERAYPDPYTPTYVFSNHDKMRSITRLEGDVRRARVVALFQFTARGVPVVYYGEEIGMKDALPPFKTAQDPIAQQYKKLPRWLPDLLGIYINRDGCRTPMQWDDGPNAGFCVKGARPWLPVNDDFKSVNVASQLKDENSLLSFFRRLLAFRRSSGALREGSLRMVAIPGTGKDLLAYERSLGEERMLVLLNFGKKKAMLPALPEYGRLLFSTEAATAVSGIPGAVNPVSGLVLGK